MPMQVKVHKPSPANAASSPRAPAVVERRRGYRQSLRASAMLRPITPSSVQPAIPVHVFELSITGVGFSASVPLEIGSVYRFDLCNRRQVPRRAEIRSCRSRRDGMYDIGAQFA